VAPTDLTWAGRIPARRRRIAVALAFCLAALFAMAATTYAVPVPVDGSSGGSTLPPPPPPPLPNCANYKWASSPRIVVHVSEFADDGGSFGDSLRSLAAINEVVDAFNDIGGTSASVTSVNTTTDPFNYGARPTDPVPTIHFGWTNNIAALNNGNPAGAITKPMHDKATCTMTGAYIAFPDTADPGGMRWDYGTPFSTSGSEWFDATPTDSSGKTWFRPSFLHELLHAFDFHHLQGQYTFMTHRSPAGFPWANRAESGAMRPLPYEIGELRRLYPASGTKYEVAALNTWFGPPTDPTDDAGGQYQLCLPSLGANTFPMDNWSGTCGVDPGPGFGTPGSTTSACSGTTLRTRFTIANSSTTSMNVSASLWFSRDETWDSGDIDSATFHTAQLNAGTSELQELTWTVPNVGRVFSYRPIVRIVAEHVRSDGSGDANSVRSDWIPLSGTVKCQPVATLP
jgi:hypothetical protein